MSDTLDLTQLRELATGAAGSCTLEPAHIAFRYEMTPEACLALLDALEEAQATLAAREAQLEQLADRILSVAKDVRPADGASTPTPEMAARSRQLLANMREAFGVPELSPREKADRRRHFKANLRDAFGVPELSSQEKAAQRQQFKAGLREAFATEAASQ